MKHTFIIDENVLAQRYVHPARKVVQFFHLINENCHKVGLNSELERKLFAWIKRRQRTLAETFPMAPGLLRSVLTRADKLRFVEDDPVAQETWIRDVGDRFLARVAVRTGGHVVFMGDKRTRQDFNGDRFRVLCVNGVTIDQALELARDT